MASKVGRVYTGLAGLHVINDAPRELAKQYGKILRALQKLPVESKYRTITENLIKEKQEILLSSPERNVIEKKMGDRTCEEWIERAKAELELIEVMKEHKPWEPLTDIPPENQWKWPL